MDYLCKILNFLNFNAFLHICIKNKLFTYTFLFFYNMSTYKQSYNQNVDKSRGKFYLKYFDFYINMLYKAKFRNQIPF